jgi:hypothetical protein
MGTGVEPDGKGLCPILIRMLLCVMRIPQIVEVPDITLRPWIDPVKVPIPISFVKISEGFLPVLGLPEFVGIVDRMACLMAKNLHDLFFGGRISLKVFQLGASQIEGNADGDLFVDTSPFVSEVEIGPQENAMVPELLLEPSEEGIEGLIHIEIQVANPTC